MPSNAAATLISLLRTSTIHDHDEALRLATAALLVNNSDTKSQRTKIVALLKLDRFHDAVRAIDEGGDRLTRLCRLELAYALYKTGELDKAAEILMCSESRTAREYRHLAAQVAYRAERFEDAINIYRDLLEDQGGSGGEENDLFVNYLAAIAQLEWQEGSGEYHSATARQDDNGGHNDSFEIDYNNACVSIAHGEFSTASALLQRAMHLCDESEDLSEEDKSAERLPLVMQYAYVLAKQARVEEAVAMQDLVPQNP